VRAGHLPTCSVGVTVHVYEGFGAATVLYPGGDRATVRIEDPRGTGSVTVFAHRGELVRLGELFTGLAAELTAAEQDTTDGQDPASAA
jgi:hypothetical protein